MRMSLIMATVNRSLEVGRMIDSLIKQTNRDFELIIVDQNEDDRLIQFIEAGRAQGLEIKHEKLSRPKLSAARNLGIAKADSEILAFPDDDCWYEADVVSCVLEAFSKDKALAGIVGKWVEKADNGESEFSLEGRKFRYFRGGLAISFTLFFRRNLLKDMNGFDDRLGLGAWYSAGEETDLIMRSLDCGYNISYLPQIQVHHPDKQMTLEELRRSGRGAGAIYAKNHLPQWVIMRGLFAPIIVPLLTMRGWGSLRRGFATVSGRIEGFMRWKKNEV